MEIPEYRNPSLKIVWKQAWFRFKDFLTIGIPLIVAGSMVIEALKVFHWLEHITAFLSPVTVWWLGLPAFCGVLLIIGILRKEANLRLLHFDPLWPGGAAVTHHHVTPSDGGLCSGDNAFTFPVFPQSPYCSEKTGFKMTTLMVLAEIILAIVIGGLGLPAAAAADRIIVSSFKFQPPFSNICSFKLITPEEYFFLSPQRRLGVYPSPNSPCQ